jgi:hypothetical protein
MKKQILVAALAVIGSSAFLSPAAQSHDHDHYWNRNVVPYGYGYGNYGYGYDNGFDNRRGFIREVRHDRREAIRDERRAVRHWDHRSNRWF